MTNAGLGAHRTVVSGLLAATLATAGGLSATTGCQTPGAPLEPPDPAGVTLDPSALSEAEVSAAGAHVAAGQQTFRYETFGDEAFWGGRLRLHEAIAGEANGGVGAGISPQAALALGLKVDVAALPFDLRTNLRLGRVDLTDPAVTLSLLRLNAVIGLTGTFADDGHIASLGIQCALCHSVVDDSFAPGIGRRLDGRPNRDLDVGGIVAAAPDLSAITALLGVDDATLRSVVSGWGRGKFDAFVLLDGKATRPDGGSAAVLIPPLFGLEGVGLVTWNAWGSLSSWIPVVINLEMHGQGVLVDRRLRDADQFPIAAANHFDNVRNDPDLATSKLADLEKYVLSLETPTPPRRSFDAAAAARGNALFTGKARCNGCHQPPLYSTPGWNAVPASVIGIDDFQAERSPNHAYRPPPLRAIFTRMKGGFFHDGRFATPADVVAHFNGQFNLQLSTAEQADLVEFLKSL